jgi:peptidoglycan-associated lipoprotein
MMMQKLTGKTVLTAIVCCLTFSLLFTGCGKKTIDSGGVSGSRKPEGRLMEGTAGPGETLPDGFAAGDLEALDEEGIKPPLEDTSTAEYQAIYGRSTSPLLPVFFDFDSSSINVDQLDILDDSGSYLLENKSDNLVIEGNCDERGTTDYNLALGELRALKVKKYLVNRGVADARITTISYGSQRPLVLGSDEEAWAANRRADLIVY